jgi:hypothetical protein
MSRRLSAVTGHSKSRYRIFHQPPIARCLYKKLLELFFPFANISLKPNFNAIQRGYFLLQYVIFYQKMKIDGSICGEKRYC